LNSENSARSASYVALAMSAPLARGDSFFSPRFKLNASIMRFDALLRRSCGQRRQRRGHGRTNNVRIIIAGCPGDTPPRTAQPHADTRRQRSENIGAARRIRGGNTARRDTDSTRNSHDATVEPHSVGVATPQSLTHTVF
jgi:hypothetical protein